jgi:transcription antitermination factor NusG
MPQANQSAAVKRASGAVRHTKLEKRVCDPQGGAVPALGERAHVELGCRLNKMSSLEKLESTVGDSSAWWALYTRHQHEKTVAEVLSNKGFDVFLPVYESVRRWKDRNKILSLPLFPCYVFVRGGMNRRLQVVTTPGVHTILYTGERIAIIPSEEIDAIRRAVNSPSRIEPHPFLRCGEKVRVTRGSLEGVVGVLVRKKSLYRLVLSVEMLAQSVSVEIDASDVEPAKNSGMLEPQTRGESGGSGFSNDLFPAGSRQSFGVMNR